MKKWLLVLSVLVIIISSILYLIIPSQENFSFTTEAACTDAAVTRCMVNKNRWAQWWPGQEKALQLYSYKNCHYRITKVLLNGFEATVFNEKDSVKGNFHAIPAGTNSVTLKWESVFTHPSNPLARAASYMQDKGIKQNIKGLMQEIKNFFDDEKNIYGFDASIQNVTDKFLITVKQTLGHYPSTEEVYKVVNAIKNYVRQKGGTEKNPPMMNVHSEKPDEYQLMVAIPTNQQITGEGEFLFRQMVLGKIIVAEIKGGLHTVHKGEEEILNYLIDHQKTSPAIPYQSLITNRVEEKDTSKWVTKLYYPIFE